MPVPPIRGHRPLRWCTAVGTVVVLASANAGLATRARADADSLYRASVAAARGRSCQPLNYHPLLQHAAEVATQSTASYLDGTARAVPIADPKPVLHDLGYGASKSFLLSGAGDSEAKALEGALIEGYKIIPDCSLVDFGMNFGVDQKSGWHLFSLVLAAQ